MIKGAALDRSRGPAPLIRSHMPELDSIRGIAVLMVVLFHGFFCAVQEHSFHGPARLLVLVSKPGWSGVNLFFVLSGFLITGILLKSSRGERYYSRFYLRRALRILPAHFAILIALLALGMAPLRFVLLSAVFLSNVTVLFGVPLAYAPLWSLAVEEHFYLLWAPIVRLFDRRGVWVCAGAICILTPLVRLVGFHLGMSDDNIHYFTWCNCDGLAMGALLRLLAERYSERHAPFVRISAALLFTGLMALVLGAGAGIATRTRILGAGFQFSCVDLVMVGFLGIVVAGGASRWAALTDRPLLAFLGYISYGLYLVHFAVFDWYDRAAGWMYGPGSAHGSTIDPTRPVLRLLIGGGVSVFIAWVSRRYYEEYFLRTKNRLSSPRGPHPTSE